MSNGRLERGGGKRTGRLQKFLFHFIDNSSENICKELYAAAFICCIVCQCERISTAVKVSCSFLLSLVMESMSHVAFTITQAHLIFSKTTEGNFLAIEQITSIFNWTFLGRGYGYFGNVQ